MVWFHYLSIGFHFNLKPYETFLNRIIIINILQKKITVDFLTKKMKVNEGEVPQYYVENSHPAIIEPSEWDLVQTEMARRKAIGRKYSGNSVLSTRLICGDCGGSKVWHNNQPYRKTIWRCNGKYAGTDRCQTQTLTGSSSRASLWKPSTSYLIARIWCLRICRRS